jgi:hypothetical protein
MVSWERRLMSLLTEIETANGPEHAQATKLEHLVRFAWDEAVQQKEHLRAPAPTYVSEV